MTEFIKSTSSRCYYLENPDDAPGGRAGTGEQAQPREREKTRLNLKKKLAGTIDISNRIQKLCGLPQQVCRSAMVYIC
jgi:DNA gyrase subunit B